MTWAKVKLGDVCSIEKGNIGIMKAIPGEYPLVVLGEDRRTHNEYQFDDDAVIIPLVSSTGHGHRSMKRIFFQTGKFSIGSILCAVVPKDKATLSAEFLYRYLDFNKQRELVSRMRGMANVTLPMKEIALVEIPLPPLDEQRKLIEEFQKLETNNNQITDELSHQLDLVSQLRQAFLREAMEGKLLPQDPVDEPAETLLKKIKAEKAKLIAEKKIKKEKPLSEIKPEEIPFEIPENWTWVRLGDVCEINGGKRVPAGYRLLTEPTPYIYVRVTDMQKGTILNNDLHYISEEIHEKIKNYLISRNDIYMTIVGATIGKCGLVPDSFDNAHLTENAVKVTPRIVDKKFLYTLLTVPFVQSQFIEKTKKVGVEKMAIFRFKNTVLPIPPLAEQKRIVEKLEKLMAYCDELEANIRTSKHHAETLLQVALKEALEPRK